MTAFENVFTGLMLVSLPPGLYSVMRGALRSPAPAVQRRRAIAMLICIAGVGAAIIVLGVGQLIEGKLVMAAGSGLCIVLIALSGIIARSHWRAAQHLVSTGERLVLTRSEERRYGLLLEVVLVLAVVIGVVGIGGFLIGTRGGL